MQLVRFEEQLYNSIRPREGIGPMKDLTQKIQNLVEELTRTKYQLQQATKEINQYRHFLSMYRRPMRRAALAAPKDSPLHRFHQIAKSGEKSAKMKGD